MAARIWALLLVVLLGLPVSGQAQLALDRSDARALSFKLFGDGQYSAARELAVTLLKQDQSDFALLLMLARADRGLGRNNTALWAAREAWKAAETDSERYAAAMVQAQVLSSRGNRSTAQFWLRRAAQIAPDEAARAHAVRDFRYVRSSNPLSTRLSFGLRPSSNINNGSRSDTIVIDGIPLRLSGGAQALSGLELSYGVSTEYRHDLNDRSSLRFGAALDGRSYTLSSSAQMQAPTARASDFAYTSVELRFGGTRQDADGGGATHFDLVYGHNWYGGEALSRFTRGSLTRDYRIGDQDLLRVTAVLEDQNRLQSAQRSSQAGTLRGSWTRRFESGARFSFGMGLRSTVSDSSSVDHDAALANIGYTLGRPILGAETAITLDIESRDYDGSAFNIARQDHRAKLGVSFLFREVDYYGFAPVVSVTAERNASNISIYDTEGLGLSLGIRSVF